MPERQFATDRTRPLALAQGDFGGGPSFRESEPLAHGLPLNGPAVHMESSMAATGSSDGEAGTQ